MGNALPVQEPTMDEILASIRRIIEGREERQPDTGTEALAAVKPSRAEAAPKREAAPVAAVPAPEIEPNLPGTASLAEASEPETAAPAEQQQLAGISVPVAKAARVAVNDEGKTPFGGRPDNALHERVASRVEELATVSVARMRAASLENAVRDQREANLRAGMADAAYAEEDTFAEAQALPNFSEEFDEVAFASELLASAGIGAAAIDDDDETDQGDDAEMADEAPVAENDADRRPNLSLVAALAEPDAPEEEPSPEPSLAMAIDSVLSEATARRDETPSDADGHADAGGNTSAWAASSAAGDAGDGDGAGFDTTAQASSSVPEPMLSLISTEVEAQVSTSFGALAEVVRTHQMERLDGTVREMLRPMLAEWLEDNLPRIVERLVREEIERVARGPARA